MAKIVGNLEIPVAAIFPLELQKDPYFIEAKTIDSVRQVTRPISQLFGLFLALDSPEIESARTVCLAEAPARRWSVGSTGANRVV